MAACAGAAARMHATHAPAKNGGHVRKSTGACHLPLAPTPLACRFRAVYAGYLRLESATAVIMEYFTKESALKANTGPATAP
jgi:hypothetical protein